MAHRHHTSLPQEKPQAAGLMEAVMEMDELNEKARRSKHQAAGGGGRGRLLMEGGAHTGGGPCPGSWLLSLLAHTWPALSVAAGVVVGRGG